MGDKGYDANTILADLEATRYDKTADSYIGFILVASARLGVRLFVNGT